MKTRILAACLAISVLVNLIALPTLAWKLFGLRMMYRRNVDYAAELGYAVGYHKALDNDLAAKLEKHPTRLWIMDVRTNSVHALIGPGEILGLDFSKPSICHASIWSEKDSPAETE